jgi:hypothetical protein
MFGRSGSSLEMRMIFPLFLILAGCGKEQPQGPTAAESAQLNEAENMLDAAANEEGPADLSTGPSNNTD